MLTEDKRKQLDTIISQMVTNKENDDTIQFVVNDFKNKYSVEEPETSFLEKTSNVLDTIPPALRDRLEIIHFAGYTHD